MQFMLIAPAKAYIVPMTRKPRLVNLAGYTFAAFDGINAYVKTGEAPRFAHTESEGFASYAIAIEPETFCYVGSAPDDAAMLERLQALGVERIVAWIADAQSAFNDLPAYNAALADKAAAKRADWEATKAANEAKIREREALAAKLEEEKQAQAEADYKSGATIPWERFERMCLKHGVIMRPNTIGAGRKGVIYIGRGNATTNRKGGLPAGIWDAVRQLNAVVGGK